MPEFEELQPEDFSREASKQRTERSFQDFLLTREIAGTLAGVPHGGFIPAEFIIDEGSKVEIVTHVGETPDELPPTVSVAEPTVLIRRTAENMVESIEFLCTCGQKVVVKIQYDDV